LGSVLLPASATVRPLVSGEDEGELSLRKAMAGKKGGAAATAGANKKAN